MNDALSNVNFRSTPQNERARADQVKNNAGGYVFGVTPETRLNRFLTLGTDGGSYYQGERELTLENTAVVADFARTNPRHLVGEAVRVSDEGLAPKNNPAIFAMAAALSLATDKADRAYAAENVDKVVRTGTHLFTFLNYAQNMRGWGRLLKATAADWYATKSVDQAAYQMVKYRQREGWTHRDVLRKAHPKTTDALRNNLYNWATHKDTYEGDLPQIVRGYLEAQKATTVDAWVDVIETYKGVTWEMLPDAALTEKNVWSVLLEKGVPQGALIRQLPRLTNLGLFEPGSKYTELVVKQLTDEQILHKSRTHPVNLLLSQKVYASGAGASSRWATNRKVVDALDEAFYKAFKNVPTTNKRFLLALDVSGSMGWGGALSSGRPLPITPREIAGAIALVTMAAEPNTTVVGFSQDLREIAISPRQRLDDALRTIDRMPMGGTDCSLPAVWAKQHGYEFDGISIYTDNETWAGRTQPFQALKAYRDSSGIPVRQVVAAFTSTNFSIADPKDPLSLDVAGFDASVPSVIGNFTAGLI